MTKYLVLAILFPLFGCSSTPMKELGAAQTSDTLRSLSGKYKVADSRQNTYSKINHIALSLDAVRGLATVGQIGGSQYKLHLRKCAVANVAQAENTGKPRESLVILIRCDIVSDYQWATFYIGQVKADYVVSDQKLLKSFDPMTVDAGYLIEINQHGSPVFLNAAKE